VAIIVATKIVGVRELKLNAPALVKRAAGGERILITRYGKARAQLGPVEAEPNESSARQTARMIDWQAERRAFQQLLPALEKRYRNRYVALHRGKVVGSGTDPDALFERTWRKLRGKTFFIGRVGAAPPIVDMPGFEIE
jgi:antitoxin (DNA-binding transcriptional repressor) of toxin-antitoxin stability system